MRVITGRDPRPATTGDGERVAWPDVAAPDPVDVRLLSAVAETGRAAVPELAARLGMDVREVASRLAVLSGTGLPLVLGVECDSNGIRNAIAAANAWGQQHSGSYPVQHGGYPSQTPHSGSYPVPTPHSGTYPVQNQPSGPYPAQNQPSGAYSVQGQHSGGHQVPPGYGGASGPHGVSPQFVPQPPQGFPQAAPPGPGSVPPQAPTNTWGPPGSASWARGDQQPAAPAAPPAQRTGAVGSKLDVDGLEGERITIQLVEVVDPADFLFTAAGYELQEGERSVVVHTELTNRGQMPFTSLPDLYLVLVAQDGTSIAKSPVSLSSRPPHRIGVPPGETAGGHTVYVLPEDVPLASLRWSPRPGDEQRTLTWDITDF